MQIRPSQTNAIANDATAQTRPRERASSTNAFRQALAGVKTDMQMVTVKPGDTLMSLTRRHLRDGLRQLQHLRITKLIRRVAQMPARQAHQGVARLHGHHLHIGFHTGQRLTKGVRRRRPFARARLRCRVGGNGIGL